MGALSPAELRRSAKSIYDRSRRVADFPLGAVGICDITMTIYVFCVSYLTKSTPIALRLSKEHKDHFRVPSTRESALTGALLISECVAARIAIGETASIAKTRENWHVPGIARRYDQHSRQKLAPVGLS